MIDRSGMELSVSRQCKLLAVNRSTIYCQRRSTEKSENLDLMRKIDEIYTDCPFYGSRRIKVELSRQFGVRVNRKRVQRLMRKMGIEGICPRRKTTKPAPDHEVFAYLLRNVTIDHVDQLWSAGITYLPMKKGFMYMVAMIDWFSRHVITWRLSNTMDSSFCVDALRDALATGRCPEIFNTDQGSQFTSKAFLKLLKDREIAISMDGRGRALDNVFIERLWRSVKYECVYLHDDDSVFAFNARLTTYFQFYNTKRPHQS